MAIDIGDIELCKRIIESGTDLEAGIEGCSGCTPLLYSLHKDQCSISRYLVSQGCSTRGSTCEMWGTRGFTALHYAAAYGDVELLVLLLEKSPSEVFLNLDPIHPIHLAILQNNDDCVKYILDHVSQGTNSYTVAILLCTDVTMTLGKGRSPSDQLGTLQEALGRILNVQVQDYDSGWNWNGEQFPMELITARPLQIAARNGNLQIVSMLLAHGAFIDSVDGRHATPSHYAAGHDRIDIVKCLVEAGANPNALDVYLESPVMRAAQQGHVNCVRTLLEAGADIQLRNIYGETALHRAAKSGAKSMFIFFMSKMSGYDLATETIWGISALYWAMSEPVAFPMSFLLSLAPSPTTYISEKCNILNAAIICHSTIGFKMLVRRIPTYLLLGLLNQRPLILGTPLHTAVIHDKLDIITLLLNTGAQLEIEACDHGTALMGACAIGRLAAVKLLVARGARTSYMQDGQIYSAFLAAKHHPDVRRWLLVGRFVEGPKLLTYQNVE